MQHCRKFRKRATKVCRTIMTIRREFSPSSTFFIRPRSSYNLINMPNHINIPGNKVVNTATKKAFNFSEITCPSYPTSSVIKSYPLPSQRGNPLGMKSLITNSDLLNYSFIRLISLVPISSLRKFLYLLKNPRLTQPYLLLAVFLSDYANNFSVKPHLRRIFSYPSLPVILFDWPSHISYVLQNLE